MNKEELKNRTKKFAVEVIKLTELFPKNTAGYVISKQIIRSATSVAANYRASLRAQSQSHFISKLNIVLEETDESLFWLELSVESQLITQSSVEHLIKEANELTSIFAASIKTLRSKKL